ncbi:MAG: cyclic nucleotide-binding domain-containing protein [Ignavibacteria bacterium]|nr:cyclic nucleotide-binding domain-containing protein [Ignavibacteria bacterium]
MKHPYLCDVSRTSLNAMPTQFSLTEFLITSIFNLFYLAGFIVKDILWLRVLIIIGFNIEMAYHFRDLHKPEWAEIIWCGFYIIVNGWQFMMLYRERRNLKFTDEELALHAKVFKNMPTTAFRKLLNIAGYEDLPNDFVMIHQDTTVDKLALISDGLAKIEVDGTIVSYVRNGQFVGEMSFLSGNLTTATVTTIDETRCLLWDKAQLRELMKKDIEVEASMQMVFSSDLLSKMMGGKEA